MKPRTLARHAIKCIKSGLFEFDTKKRQKEAMRQMKSIISGEPKYKNEDLDDPIIDFHIKVYVPNYDYPIIPVDKNNEPIVWEEDFNYYIPSTNIEFKGVGLSGELYYMQYLYSLAPFRNANIKVDKYIDLDRAACTLVSAMSQIDYETKRKTMILINDNPIKLEYDELVHQWKNNCVDNIFEETQHKLYIKWLQKWISIYGKNPETHMKNLKLPKN